MASKAPDAFRTISEVSEILDTPPHVLRFWETKFTQVKPVKRAGGRRYYRPADLELLAGIKQLLHDDGLTIRGVQKLLRERGVRHVAALAPPLDVALSEAHSPEYLGTQEGQAPDGSGNGLAHRQTSAPEDGAHAQGEAKTPASAASPREAVAARSPDLPAAQTGPPSEASSKAAPARERSSVGEADRSTDPRAPESGPDEVAAHAAPEGIAEEDDNGAGDDDPPDDDAGDSGAPGDIADKVREVLRQQAEDANSVAQEEAPPSPTDAPEPDDRDDDNNDAVGSPDTPPQAPDATVEPPVPDAMPPAPRPHVATLLRRMDDSEPIPPERLEALRSVHGRIADLRARLERAAQAPAG